MVYISGLPSRSELNAIFLSLHSTGISGLAFGFENIRQAIETKIARQRDEGTEALFNFAGITLVQSLITDCISQHMPLTLLQKFLAAASPAPRLLDPHPRSYEQFQ